jgi:large subunit ribosomal protein L21
MFAVLKTGGKQYRVTAGDMLRVELFSATAGETVQFNDILMVGATVGAPFVAGAAVQAEVVDNIKADKVITYRKRRRKHSSQRTRGHRQQLTLLKVTGILEKGAEKSGVREAVGARIAARAAHNTDPAPKAEKAAAPKAAAPKADKPAKAAAPKAAPKPKAEAAPAAKAAKKPAAKKPAAKKE